MIWQIVLDVFRQGLFPKKESTDTSENQDEEEPEEIASETYDEMLAALNSLEGYILKSRDVPGNMSRNSRIVFTEGEMLIPVRQSVTLSPTETSKLVEEAKLSLLESGVHYEVWVNKRHPAVKTRIESELRKLISK